jgi:DNA-binding response OmpR family regulator
MAKIVFTGLEQRVQTDLGRVLGDEGHEVTVEDAGDFDGADAVFCNGDCPTYPLILRQIRDLRPGLPIVVVTRVPESDKWLSALEAGADDYCSAPFEAIQVRWILSAVMSRGASRSAS